MKKILLTGGGTAGHVTPNIALLPDLKAEGYDIHYIGSYEGMEKKLITAQGIHYDGIATGKFRRYLSAKNLTDPFRVIKGFQQAKSLSVTTSRMLSSPKAVLLLFLLCLQLVTIIFLLSFTNQI